MMRLLLTRPEEDSLPLANHLEKMGIQCLIAPMLTIHHIPNGAIADTHGLLPVAVQDSDDDRPWYSRLFSSSSGKNGLRLVKKAAETPQAILLTSHHAVVDRDISAWIDIPVYAVGNATAAAARAEGFTDVRVTGNNVNQMAQQVNRNHAPEAGVLMYLRGREVSHDMPALLPNFKVKEIITYAADAATKLPDQAHKELRQGIIDGVVFFSPRSAKVFVNCVEAANMLDVLQSLDAYCLSQTISWQLESKQWNQIYTSATPDGNAMASLLTKQRKLKRVAR